jgi:putative endonuclease
VRGREWDAGGHTPRARRGPRASLARDLLRIRLVSSRRVELGKIGEDLASRELERRGYAIVARRYRRRGGEIDIVARDGPTIAFVEVKTRDGGRFGSGADAVTVLKRRRMAQVASEFLVRHRLTECPCRFDVVSIQLGAGHPVIEVFQNAFSASQ